MSIFVKSVKIRLGWMNEQKMTEAKFFNGYEFLENIRIMLG